MTRSLALALALAALPGAAAAAPPVEPRLAAGRLEVDADLSSAFPADLEQRVGNGLTNVVAIHVALLPARGGAPAAIAAREIQVLYDVWEERFGVVVRDAAAPRGRRLAFATFRELRAFLSSGPPIALAPADALVGGRWVVQARVELNPVSRELVERTRELLANPAAGRGGTSRSVLGAMASYLLREPPEGAEVRVLRSAPFEAGEVRAR